MRATALPTGATTMLQIIVLMAVFAVVVGGWLWWQNRRIANMTPARERYRTPV